MAGCSSTRPVPEQTGMNANETSEQETDEPTDDELAARRARWEGFEFRVPVPGRVRVENTSYGDASDKHVYVVEVAEHVGATACTCPSDEYRAAACKHRRAVEEQPAVMQAATDGLNGAYRADEVGGSDATAIATDGGESR